VASYEERTYRKRVQSEGLVSFRLAVKETDLLISAKQNLENEARDIVHQYRHQVETYILSHPDFLESLYPYPEDPFAPPMVKEMIRATREVGVGPMASVAGAIAQFVGNDLLPWTDEVIVENGGDIFLNVARDVTVSVFAGNSLLSEKIGLGIDAGQMPLGICSSSGTVGHSLSGGVADVACILSPSAVFADGAATALGNRIKHKGDLEGAASWAQDIKGISGGLIIVGDAMSAWGDVVLVKL
jgi:ApbE superfamily uncharacterized protein (UPF0280 family)